MRKKLFLNGMSFLFLLCGVWTWGQSAGFNSTFVVLNVNGSGNTYYDLQANTANPDFQNAQLGTFCTGSAAIILKGAEHNNWKCNGCDITATHLYYRVYLIGVS